MQPKKIITIVASILLLGTFTIVGTLYSTDAEVDELMQKYYGTTQNFDRVSVQHIISTIEEDEPGINDPGGGGSNPGGGSGGSNPPPPGIPNNTDGLTITKHIASHFKNSAGDFEYTQTGGTWTSDITFNGRTVANTTSSHCDCSCFASLFLYLSGTSQQYVHRTSATFDSSYANVLSCTNFSDTQVGDVLWVSGHVGIVVHKDGTNTYVGDCGSTEKIKRCAADGYAYVYANTDKVTCWLDSLGRSGDVMKVKGVR